MRKRDVAVFGGMIAVVIATAFVLTRGCHSAKEDACSGGRDPGLVAVLVVTQDVEAGQEMDSLIEDDLLKQIEVPLATLARGAATDVAQLKGKSATRPIRKDEQITLRYLR